MTLDGMHTVGLVLGLLLAGCGATRLEEADWKKRTTVLAAERGAEDPEATVLSDGSGALLTGTRAIFVIERGPKDGPKKRWDVFLDGPANLRKEGGSYATLSFDGELEDGTPVREHRKAYAYPGLLTVSSESSGRVSIECGQALMPLGLMQGGLLESCQLASQPPPEDDMASDEKLVYLSQYLSHLFSLLSMSQMANNSPAIRKLMLETVQFPSWWSLLTLSVKVEPVLNVLDAEPVDTAYGKGFRIPMELKLNGDPALYATVTVVEPKGALILSSGIIALDGFAPHRPDDVLTVRFVGSEQLPTDGPPLPMALGYTTVEAQ